MSNLATCSVASNLVSITYPFGSGTYQAYSTAGLTFVISPGGYNPLSEKDSGDFYLNTYDIIGGVNCLIDTNSFSTVYTPTRGLIGMSIHLISSYRTYDSPTEYTFQIIPTKKMPGGSMITITIPPVITLIGSTIPQCTYTINGHTADSTSMLTLSVSQRPYL